MKNVDGSFSFSARTTGSESGIKDQALKTAPDAETVGLTVKEANGSYGEFLRVDLTGDYGDLAANLQTVTWTYYGDDSTYTNAKATYGTKFAADNWMHKVWESSLALPIPCAALYRRERMEPVIGRLRFMHLAMQMLPTLLKQPKRTL